MFYSFVVFCVLAGPCPMRVDDLRGPYATAEECFLRSSVLVKEVALRYPLIKVEGVCMEVSPEELFKEEDNNDPKETSPGKHI